MVGSTAQFLNPGAWGGVFHTGVRAGTGDLTQAWFWSAVVQVVFVNVLLSGDNAVVIAMACRGLPPRQRFWGLAIGAGFAVILLIVFAVVMTRLLELPYVKLAGGLALIYIAAKLVAPEDADSGEVTAALHLWRAVRIVVVADIIMSFDNILAIVEIAKGNLALLAIGLTVSIPLIVAGAALITALLDRLPILVWAGAALLGWVAGETIFSDPVIWIPFVHAAGETFAGWVEWVAAGAGAVLAIAAGALWRHRHVAKALR
jgi:YjbE family integral membrane protein